MLAHEVLDPKNTLSHVKYCHLTLYLHLLRYEYYIVNIPHFFSLCDLGVIIPIGRGGLCKTSKRLYPPYNSIGIGPVKNPHC
jgi:hypothetical protein